MIKKVVATEEPNNRQGGVFDYVSPSQLSLWAKCPLAFKLKHVEATFQR